MNNRNRTADVMSKNLTDKQKTYIEAVLLLFIILFALLLRLLFTFGIPNNVMSPDEKNYDAMTRQLLDTGVFGYMSVKPNAYVTPGYPLFLAAVYAVFGYNPTSPLMQVKIIQSVISAVTCLIVYLIGKKVRNKFTGFISALVYAIYPTFAWSSSLILTEVLYNFFFLLYFYLQLLTLEKKSKTFSMICGIIFAAAILIRPLAFPLLVIPYIYYFWFVSRNRYIIKLFGYSLLGSLVLMVPWWARNIISTHRFILLATQTGNPLLAGAFPYFEKMNTSVTQFKDQLSGGLQIIINGFLTQPLLYLKWFTIGKLNIIFFKPWFYPGNNFSFLGSIVPIHYFIIVLGFIGLLFWTVRKNVRFFAVYTIMLTCLQLVFIPEPRYAYSIIPFLIIAAACLLDYIFFRSREKAPGY
ncbi:MAG: glycosyltransferase family 39 protein [Bacillota bacterium]|nr:glycosyltransferase family 39 protein [Bacillota bacterium]